MVQLTVYDTLDFAAEMPPTAGGGAENIGIGVGSGGSRGHNGDCVPEMKSTLKVDR